MAALFAESHQRGHGVRVERLAPFGSEDQPAAVGPDRTCCLSFFCLTAAVTPQDAHGFAVDADHMRPAALGSPFHALAAHHGGGVAECDLGSIQVDRLPAEVEQLAAPSAGVGGQPVEGVKPVRSCGGQEGAELLSSPDPIRFSAPIPRELRSFGWVDGQKLLDVDGICQRLRLPACRSLCGSAAGLSCSR